MPILSVDYSLSPEAPFPRALEECFYAYCWALRNPHLLGTSAAVVRVISPSICRNWDCTVQRSGRRQELELKASVSSRELRPT